MNDVKNQNDNAAGGYASPEKVPPNVMKLAQYIHSFDKPRDICSRFVGILEVCGNDGNQSLAELQIRIGDVTSSLDISHPRKELG